MDALKRKRSAHSGTITRLYNKLQRILDDNPDTFDVSYLRRQLESVAAYDVSYHKIHSDICESYTDDINEGDEANTLDQHEDSIVKITSLIERLITIHDIHASLLDLQYRIEVLGRAIGESPKSI